jgi:uncharacterized protein YacL (UPF0231 family)
MPTLDIKLPTILINKETGETKFVSDDSPEVIAMEVRHISVKRWLTREDKENLSKAADIIEELINYKKSWDICGGAIANAFGFNSDILIDGKDVSVKTYEEVAGSESKHES